MAVFFTGEWRACGGFLAVASLVFLLLSIFLPGIEWFGLEKLVVFSDTPNDSSLEVRSSFHYGYLWARQRIATELDAVVFEEDGYGWCAGTTPGMPAPTQAALCGARRLMWACTAIYLLLGLLTVLLSCRTSSAGGGVAAAASPSSGSPTSSSGSSGSQRSARFLAHGLTLLAGLQLLAGAALGWMWTGIKRGIEAYFTANYTEVNVLVLRVGWSWYLAGFAGLAATALLALSLRLSCLAERQARRAAKAAAQRRRRAGAGAAAAEKRRAAAQQRGTIDEEEDADAGDFTTMHSPDARYNRGGAIQPGGPVPSGPPSEASSSRASSRSASPVRAARAAAAAAAAQQQQQQRERERRYPSRQHSHHHQAPTAVVAEAERAYHYS